MTCSCLPPSLLPTARLSQRLDLRGAGHHCLMALQRATLVPLAGSPGRGEAQPCAVLSSGQTLPDPSPAGRRGGESGGGCRRAPVRLALPPMAAAQGWPAPCPACGSAHGHSAHLPPGPQSVPRLSRTRQPPRPRLAPPPAAILPAGTVLALGLPSASAGLDDGALPSPGPLAGSCIEQFLIDGSRSSPFGLGDDDADRAGPCQPPGCE